MYQLVYISEVSDNFNPNDFEKGIDQIWRRSTIANNRNDISGILLYLGTHFVQLIEGESEQVLKLFRKISKDPRHKNIQVVIKQEVSERTFEFCSMGFLDTEGLSRDDIERAMDCETLIKMSVAGARIPRERVLDIFESFRRKLEHEVAS